MFVRLLTATAVAASTTASISLAGPATVGQSTSQVGTEWTHDSTPFTKPDQTILQMQSTGSSTPIHVQPRPAAPPQHYTPMYKCGTAQTTSYQDTPCNNTRGMLYHTKDNPITPVY